MTTTPDARDGRRDLSVGMVGYAFMGAAHSHAWRTAPRFFDLPLRPRMAAVALAAALFHADALEGDAVICVASGGNVDSARFAEAITAGR